MNVLILHPEPDIAEELAEVLQEYGLNALPLTRAVDAMEHVEKFRFAVALVCADIPDRNPAELAELLYHLSRDWLEVLLIEIPPDGLDVADFVLRVREAVVESTTKSYYKAEALYAAWDGEAGEDIYSGSSLTQAEWDAKFEELKRLLAAKSHPTSSDS